MDAPAAGRKGEVFRSLQYPREMKFHSLRETAPPRQIVVQYATQLYNCSLSRRLHLTSVLGGCQFSQGMKCSFPEGVKAIYKLRPSFPRLGHLTSGWRGRRSDVEPTQAGTSVFDSSALVGCCGVVVRWGRASLESSFRDRTDGGRSGSLSDCCSQS